MIRNHLLNKIGQLFVVGFTGTSVTDEMKKLIHDYQVGHVILFSRNIGSPEEVRQLTSALQNEAKKAGHTKPLLICLDQENGIVRRLKEPVTVFPGPMSLGAADDLELCFDIGLATGHELKELGINWNLAPVVDVNNNPNNPVINVRSFGGSPQKVARLAASWFKGQQSAGVASTLKHFPGHGDTDVDSHLDLPVIHHSLERLFDSELIPFVEGIKQEADVIMSAHIYFSALEQEFGKPATLSRNVLTELLRKKLGFNGVITTDCLEMNAISETVGVAKGAVEAIKSGADLAMISHTFERQVCAIEALEKAVIDGEITENEIEQHYQRIMNLKDKYTGSWTEVLKESVDFEFVGSNRHRVLSKLAYQKSVTMIKNNTSNKWNEFHKIYALFPKYIPLNQAEDKRDRSPIEEALIRYDVPILPYEINEDINDFHFKSEDLKILFIYSLSKKDFYSSWVQSMINKPNTMVISVRGPYPFKEMGDIQNGICVYDDAIEAIHAALDVGLGRSQADGRLPVSL
ncbi:beta-N-acetylhexosaminidase [Pullulanibacillus sp. KACC 23026]|uniref:beta-N-acetylhexosaminidase n=1 Tax=Pullulanibacillus sp. KACC 23026 TaxID=3028315 RepID=UPI0023AF1B7D|nr:beta-N-acetylhexosaminidase [Pullulanibacillus sp. KACC 23026]WEG14734.1 beta-N-acetylhexosaminidase [Pullulanibacillus sp. KACC 23026]